MALLALLALVVLVAVLVMIVLALGIWSPYWAASGWTRRRDRRQGLLPPAERVVDRRAETRHIAARLGAWLRHVNGRF